VTLVCATCGALYPDAPRPPSSCAICEDERQWVPLDGQRWTSLEELAAEHRVEFREEEPGLLGLGLDPSFAIEQRMLLVETPMGNVLWDMIPLATEDAVAEVQRRGGAVAIAVSHPHYYSGIAEWSDALGGIPVLLHAADRSWVLRPDAPIEHWRGETYELLGGLRLLRLGGHFPGGTVLHWPGGADGRGALLSGDLVQVLEHGRSVTFMWSYPNVLPLPAHEVERIVAALEPVAFDRIWGAWWDRVIRTGAKAVVRDSAAAYLRAARGEDGRGS
jgi:hypothetical protein